MGITITGNAKILADGVDVTALAQAEAMTDDQELRRAICAIGVVMNLDGHDLIRRDSAIEIVRRREADIARMLSIIKECRGALAEELAAWDIDPPLDHVKKAHDRCVEFLSGGQP